MSYIDNKKRNSSLSEEETKPFMFSKSNYRLLLLSIGVVTLGFMLMIGDTDIYEFRKIVLAPIVVLIGFAIGFFSILTKAKESKE